jgi:hypothetical protein
MAQYFHFISTLPALLETSGSTGTIRKIIRCALMGGQIAREVHQ